MDLVRALVGGELGEAPGANLARRNNFGGTPLHEASLHGHAACASLLMELTGPSDVHALDHSGLTPLHAGNASVMYIQIVVLMPTSLSKIFGGPYYVPLLCLQLVDGAMQKLWMCCFGVVRTPPTLAGHQRTRHCTSAAATAEPWTRKMPALFFFLAPGLRYGIAKRCHSLSANYPFDIISI